MAKSMFNLITFLVILAFVFFAYGVIKACFHTITNTPGDMPEFLSTAVTGIAAVFATHLGSVIGINLLAHKFSNTLLVWKPIKISGNDLPFSFQMLACYFYVFVLLIVLIVWALKGFTEDGTQVVSLIPDMAKSLLGIIVGALGVVLNVHLISKAT